MQELLPAAGWLCCLVQLPGLNRESEGMQHRQRISACAMQTSLVAAVAPLGQRFLQPCDGVSGYRCLWISVFPRSRLSPGGFLWFARMPRTLWGWSSPPGPPWWELTPQRFLEVPRWTWLRLRLRNGEREFGTTGILAVTLSPAAVPARCCDDRNPCSL